MAAKRIFAVFAFFVFQARGNPSDPVQCKTDIGVATKSLTKAGLDIAAATEVCNPGDNQDLDKCEQDINDIAGCLTNCSDAIIDATVACGNGTETACTLDAAKLLDDLGDATIAVADAVIDCPNPDEAVKCTNDILAATEAFTYVGFDIDAMVNDC